jgi:hypothetical protein
MVKYHLAGDKVIYETNSIDRIYYIYDSSGNLINDNGYYYIENGQGDITSQMMFREKSLCGVNCGNEGI